MFLVNEKCDVYVVIKLTIMPNAGVPGYRGLLRLFNHIKMAFLLKPASIVAYSVHRDLFFRFVFVEIILQNG
jgi:hypothetical protein